MRFDPTNPNKVPAVVPTPIGRKKRQQKIPPPPSAGGVAASAPVATQPANVIDLASVVFETPKAVGRDVELVSAPPSIRPSWRKFAL
ncbi:MAG TPA: hypothetical protein VGR14_22395 [Verrucomicrobiae bacterium]|jgi:hypothetical protein|nr:hypothetical protein [Verrucomicrobiae bacterium]